jgi:hypothetical protein
MNKKDVGDSGPGMYFMPMPGEEVIVERQIYVDQQMCELERKRQQKKLTEEEAERLEFLGTQSRVNLNILTGAE